MNKEQLEELRYKTKNRELLKLGLSTRIVNALQQVGVTTFDLLLQVTVKELHEDVPNLGKVSIDSILALVSSKGYKLVGQDLYEEKQLRKKPRREWVGLTDEQLRTEFGKLYPNDIGILELSENNRDFAIEAIGARHHWVAFQAGARVAEAKLKENT